MLLNTEAQYHHAHSFDNVCQCSESHCIFGCLGEDACPPEFPLDIFWMESFIKVPLHLCIWLLIHIYEVTSKCFNVYLHVISPSDHRKCLIAPKPYKTIGGSQILPQILANASDAFPVKYNIYIYMHCCIIHAIFPYNHTGTLLGTITYPTKLSEIRKIVG